MQKKECIILTRYLERRYSSSTSESLEMFTSMMGWGGGEGAQTCTKKKKQRILMAIGRNPETKNHPVWD